jgi:hypothetical protein
MDVAAWLRGLGLEQYAPAFRDNDVDGEVLPELTADDLISIGVTSVGHRRKLLAAIAALGTEPPTVALSTASPTSVPISPPTFDAERRQLTVMFCDLVGSTALSARLDPEDLRELIGDYHRVVSETVGHFDGFVAKYMGDGVLIYFGYPQRGEAETRAALDRLVAAGLVFQRGAPPAAEYQFKHALIQDTAYGTLLRGPRQALHERIAEAIQEQSPEIVERSPEILALHLTEAGELDSAATYWLEAGRRASGQSANIEAAAHLARGIAGLSGLPETPERLRQELAPDRSNRPPMRSSLCRRSSNGPCECWTFVNASRRE